MSGGSVGRANGPDAVASPMHIGSGQPLDCGVDLAAVMRIALRCSPTESASTGRMETLLMRLDELVLQPQAVRPLVVAKALIEAGRADPVTARQIAAAGLSEQLRADFAARQQAAPSAQPPAIAPNSPQRPASPGASPVLPARGSGQAGQGEQPLLAQGAALPPGAGGKALPAG